MMSFTAYFWGLLWLLGIPVGVPSNATVSAIESRVAGHKCVGSLASWHRHYQYQQRGLKIDRSIVSIDFVKAGHNGLPAGRFSTEPVLLELDDSQHLLVFADYDIATGKISGWVCDWNFPWRHEANGS